MGKAIARNSRSATCLTFAPALLTLLVGLESSVAAGKPEPEGALPAGEATSLDTPQAAAEPPVTPTEAQLAAAAATPPAALAI
jgi:hypothetical protein